MNNLNKQVNMVNLETAKKQITKKDIIMGIQGKNNSIISYFTRSFVALICSLIVPSILVVIYIGIAKSEIDDGKWYLLIFPFVWVGLIAGTGIFIFVRTYTRQKFQFLNRYKFRLILLLLLEISISAYGGVYFIIAFHILNPIITFPLLMLYYLFIYRLLKTALCTKVYDELNKRYDQKIKIKKWQLLLSKLPAYFFGLMLIVMQVYRVSRPIFTLNHYDNPGTTIFGVIGDVGYIFVAIAAALMPLILFDADLFIRGKILLRYPEALRKEYDISETEFYDEDYLINHPKSDNS